MSANDSELARLVAELNRSANRAPRSSDKTAASPRDLDQLLALAAQRQASDLLLVANSPIAFRINGALATASTALTSSEEVRSYLQPLLTVALAEELDKNRSVDFCFMRPNIGRFRANVHYQRGSLAAAIRLLPAQIPSLDSLHLPAILAPLAERRLGRGARSPSPP
jgi:twitching motility protein PilT